MTSQIARSSIRATSRLHSLLIGYCPLFSPVQLRSLANLSRGAFLLTFAGVALRTNISELRRQGVLPFLVRAVGELVIVPAVVHGSFSTTSALAAYRFSRIRRSPTRCSTIRCVIALDHSTIHRHPRSDLELCPSCGQSQWTVNRCFDSFREGFQIESRRVGRAAGAIRS